MPDVSTYKPGYWEMEVTYSGHSPYISTQPGVAAYHRDQKPDRVRSPGGSSKRWRSPNSYYRVITDYSVPTAKVEYNRPGWYSYKGQGHVLLAGNELYRNGANLTPDYRLQQMAEMSALLSIKDMSADLATNLATYKQTSEFVTDVVKRIYGAYSAVRRRDFRRARRLLNIRRGGRQITNDWLAYQYAVSPLLSDVYGAMEQLYDIATFRQENIITGKGRASDVLDEEWAFEEYGRETPLRFKLTGSQSCFVRIDAIPTEAFIRNAATRTGLTNPATVAWELVPFSFVADWFLPIGDYFQSLDATFGLEFLGGSLSNRVMYETVCSEGSTRDTGFSDHKYTLFREGRARTLALYRHTYNAFPRPVPLYYKDPFSYKRLANALSILAGLAR